MDLFCGVGGLSLGAARAGFDVCGAVDNDPHAFVAHKQNFRSTRHLQIDISNLTGAEMRNVFDLHNEDLTGIIGGPPCQGFSSMGKNNVNDPRNQLFVECFRVISEALPKFFLVENVPGILLKKNSVTVEKALSYVTDRYIVLPPMVISANEYGAPTTRKRVFFFGFIPDMIDSLTSSDLMTPPNVTKVLVKDAFQGLRKRISPTWQKEEQGWRVVHAYGDDYYASRLHKHIPRGVGDPIALYRLINDSRASGFLGTVHSDKVAERYAKIENGKFDAITKSYRLDLNGFCPTLRAGTGADKGSFQAVRPLHPTENRVITPREAARLQGFPDWFQFSPTKWHSFRQIGSSVSPIVAERILTRIRKSIGDA